MGDFIGVGNWGIGVENLVHTKEITNRKGRDGLQELTNGREVGGQAVAWGRACLVTAFRRGSGF